MFCVASGLFAWASLVAYFSTDGPNTQAVVMSSGIYCLVSLQNLSSGLLFFVPGIVTIGVFLVHRYALIFLYLKHIRRRVSMSPVRESVSAPETPSGKPVIITINRVPADVPSTSNRAHTPSPRTPRLHAEGSPESGTRPSVLAAALY